MADTLEIEIVTPERLVVREIVDEVQIPGKNGYLGILPGHAPLITELGVGQISYKKGGTTSYLAVAWGFAEVLPGKVTILAETAELAQEIDVSRAQRALETARSKMTEAASEQQSEAARNALARAESRLLAASSAGLADMAHLVP